MYQKSFRQLKLLAMDLKRVLFLFLLCIKLSIALPSVFEIEQSQSDESVVLGEIITNYLIKYLSEDQIFVSIILPPSEKDPRNFEDDLFANLFDDPTLTQFAHNTLDELDYTIRGHRNAFNIILIDDSKSLSKILNDDTIHAYQLSQRFLIVVTFEIIQNNVNALDDISELLWKNSLINSHILIQDQPQFWALYTFEPYQNDCFTLAQIKIEYFTPLNFTENITVSKHDLFLKKLNDFHQCPLNIATSVVDPFVTLHNASDLSTRYGGVDIDIVEQISKLLNFVAIFTNFSDGTGHGIIFPNDTVTGTMKLVFDGSAEFAIGGYILSKERTQLFSPTNPYLQASIGFCFKETKAYSPLTRLSAPFQYRVWIIIGSILFTSMVVILLTKKLSRKWRHFYIGGRMNRNPILNMWNSFLGMPIANRRISRGQNFGNFARTLTILWILVWLIMRNAYQGSLYTYLQSHRLTSPYDTVEKIRRSNCKILSTPSTYNLIRHIFSRDRIIFSACDLGGNLQLLYDQDIADKTVALSTDLIHKNFNLKNSPHRRLAFTKDRLFMYSPVFLFRKKSMLTQIFDYQLQLLREAGLIDFWIKNRIDDRKSKSKYRKPSKLQMENIIAAFEICGILYFVSFLVFILEIISVRHRRIQVVLDYLTY